MLRINWVVGCAGAVMFTLLVAASGCNQSAPKTDSAASAASPTASPSDPVAGETAEESAEHGHEAGGHGGIIVSLGRDSYHVEAIVTEKGELQLYTLGNDETRVLDVETQELVAYVKPSGGADSVSLQLQPKAQPGDGSGKASLFVTQLPEALIGQSLVVTVPNITIGGERFRLSFSTQTEEHGEDSMPTKVADDEERKLYLTAGGIYTQADIEANGNMTASEKFRGFMAKHDMNPKSGDKICPVTMTKANPQCAWIVGGKTYEFCCPPCVDEFVSWAKNEDTIKDILEPDAYVKK
jgi:YHS domain-containing protein